MNAFLFASLIAAAAWAYWPALGDVLHAWWDNPDYNHGFIVVPLAAWLLYQRRKERPDLTSQIGWGGLGFIVLAAALKIASGRLYLPELDPWSFPLWLFGAVWLLWGWRFAWWAAPSIAFLWFATPLPGTVEMAVSGPLQLIAAELSGFTLRLIGQPAITEGTTILIGEHILDVERACSGLRMFYGIAAFSIGTIALTRPAKWKAAIILLSAAPVAIFANVLRIAITGILVTHVSGEAAHKFSHDFAGLVMIPVGFGFFLLILWILKFFEGKFEIPEGKDKSSGLRWVVATSLAVIVLAGGVAWLGQEQKERIAVTLLETSRRYEAEEKWQQAVDYLDRYAAIRPDDGEALIKLAEIARKAARNRRSMTRAIDLQVRAWRENSDRLDLLQSAASMAMQMQEYGQAIELAEQGLRADDQSRFYRDFVQLRADALQHFMRWDRASGKYGWQDVIQALEQAVDLSNSPVRNYASLADAYRQETSGLTLDEARTKSAELLDDLINERPQSSAVWLARYLYYQKHPDSTRTEQDDDLTKAVELARKNGSREDLATILVAARVRSEDGDTEQAKDLLKYGIQVAPEDHRVYSLLAELQRRDGEPYGLKDAESTLRKGLAHALQDDVTMTLQLASVLSAQGQYPEAEELLEPIEKLLPRAIDAVRWPVSLQVAMVRAEIAAGREGITEAIDVLKDVVRLAEVRRSAQANSRYLSQALTQLGDYYAAIGEFDQATEVYRDASTVNPAQSGVRLRIAGHALKSGDYEYAQRLYEQVLADEPNNNDALLGVAVVLLQQELRRPVEARNWRRLQSILDQAAKAGARPESVALVTTGMLEAQAEFDRAKQLLEQVIDDHSDSAELWRALTLVHHRTGDTEKALEASDRYVELSDSKTSAITTKASILHASGNNSAAEMLMKSHFETVSPQEKSVATLAYASFMSRSGRSADANRLLREVFESSLEEGKSELAEALAESAWLRGDWKELEQYEQWFREKEGADGSWWRVARIYRLINSATSVSGPEFREAHSLVNELRDLRPRWPRTFVLQGEVALRLNQFDAAVEAYKTAWKLGGRELFVADRLLELLTRQGRFEEATSFIGEVQDYLEVSERLFDRAIPYYVRWEREGALKIAEDWVERAPEDPANHLRLGRVLMILAQSQAGEQRQSLIERAAAEFQAAVRLGPLDPNTWISTILFYSREVGNREQALALLQDFSKQVEIDPLDRAFVMAQVFESEGMQEEACKSYHQAIQLLRVTEDAPDRKSNAAYVLARASHFYASFEPYLAEKLAREARKLAPNAPLARLALLRSLARHSDDESLSEAFQLLEGNGATDLDALVGQDRRFAAMLFARREQTGDLQKAIQLIERSLSTTSDDLLQLVSLYEKDDRIAPAWDILNRLVVSEQPRLRDLSEFLRFWQTHLISPEALRSGNAPFVRSADQVYLRLASSLPGQKEVFRGKLREAILMLEQDPLSVDVARATWAKVLEIISKVRDLPQDDAASMYRQRLVMTFFQVMLEEGHASVACQLSVDGGFTMENPEALSSLVTALIMTDPDHSCHEQTKTFFSELEPAGELDWKLRATIGDYLLLQGRYEQATEFYTAALTEDNESLSIANNLALALIESDNDGSLAWDNYHDAVKSHGESDELLDTRAVLEFVSGQIERSLVTLRTAAKSQPNNAVIHLHLAMALDAAKDQKAAHEHYSQALALGIRTKLLLPRDRAFLKKMDNLDAPTNF